MNLKKILDSKRVKDSTVWAVDREDALKQLASRGCIDCDVQETGRTSSKNGRIEFEVLDSCGKKRKKVKDSEKLYYFGDHFFGECETDLTFEELVERALDSLNPDGTLYAEVSENPERVFDIDWSELGEDSEGIRLGTMDEYDPEEWE